MTDKWEKRGAKEEWDYAILTNEIIQGAFDMTVDSYKKLKRENKINEIPDIFTITLAPVKILE